jgi:hypothetical protein
MVPHQVGAPPAQLGQFGADALAVLVGVDVQAGAAVRDVNRSATGVHAAGNRAA